jgi:hypothetical protein
LLDQSFLLEVAEDLGENTTQVYDVLLVLHHVRDDVQSATFTTACCSETSLHLDEIKVVGNTKTDDEIVALTTNSNINVGNIASGRRRKHRDKDEIKDALHKLSQAGVRQWRNGSLSIYRICFGLEEVS